MARGVSLKLAELSALGVKRVSVGSALARAALAPSARRAGDAGKRKFSFVQDAVSYRAINAIFAGQ